jgi:hypothetical protein
MRQKPLLLVDVDGVISLFGSPAPWLGLAAGFPAGAGGTDDGEDGETSAGRDRTSPGREDAPSGSLHTIDGVPHFLSRAAAGYLLELAGDFELVWASGWEEKADEHLPHLLGLPAGMPFLRFDHGVSLSRSHKAHWKLAAIDAHAGTRPLAWIDDSLGDDCYAWARQRRAPTLLVRTAPERGLTAKEAKVLAAWARIWRSSLDRTARGPRPAGVAGWLARRASRSRRSSSRPSRARRPPA